MKKLLAFSIALVLLFATACGGGEQNFSAPSRGASSAQPAESVPDTESSHKEGSEGSEEASLPPEIPVAEFEFLGNPYSESYSKHPQSNAHIPWDLAIFGNKLFVGSGDYDANTGPTPMKHFDFESGEWVDNGTLPDEAVMRFVTVGDSLIATGTDPRGSWSTGNYYLWDSEKWVVKRVLPKAVHNFDIVQFGDLIFAAGGALKTENMVCVSADGGKSFKPVPFHCQNEITDNLQKRVYQLFVVNNKLFALLADCSVYEYRESGFEFVTLWKGNADFRAKVTQGGALYFAETHLFRVADVKKGERIDLGDCGTVFDICEFGNEIYATASKLLENGEYQVSVFCGRNSNFTKLFEFTYSQPAFSLAVSGSRFCFGMGDYSKESTPNPHCGDILLVEFEK